MPSSRTPEGYPIRCHVCGQHSRVASSFPAFDSICPSCGSFLWLDPKRDPSKATSPEISWPRFLELVSEFSCSGYKAREIERSLLTGLRATLPIDRALSWEWKPKTRWSRRRAWRMRELYGDNANSPADYLQMGRSSWKVFGHANPTNIVSLGIQVDYSADPCWIEIVASNWTDPNRVIELESQLQEIQRALCSR